MDLPKKYAERTTLKVTEVAEMLCCQPRTIIRHIESGSLIATNVAGAPKTLWRVAAGDLIRWMHSRSNQALTV